MAMVSGGELLVRTLLRAGVKTVFGLHGAHIETIFQSCLDHGVPIVDTRHEVAAGHAAEGYARATRGLGVALVTAGPGFTNLITSIANAHLDRTPVLYLAGSAGLGDAETNTLQAGIDQVAIATPITKWAHRICQVQQIPRLVAQAIRLATSAPSGPVLLDLPADVLRTMIDEDAAPVVEPLLVDTAALPQPAAIEAALALLATAARPVILVGAGAYWSDAGEALARFAETTGIPVYSDFQAHGLLPSSHPLYAGTFHKLADLEAPKRPDVVLAAGVRFGLFTLGSSDVLVPRAAKIIHIEADPKELGRIRPAAVAIAADPRETLAALTDGLADRLPGTKLPDWTGWRQRIADAKAARAERARPDLESTGERIHPLQAVTTIVEHLPPDATVVGDGAEAYHWMNEAIRQELPGSYVTHGFLGAVGMGLGLAIGVQTAHRDRPVLCLVGDGAVGFTIAELDSMVRHGLPVVALVMNNRSWAASQHFQEMTSGANRVHAAQSPTDRRLSGRPGPAGCSTAWTRLIYALVLPRRCRAAAEIGHRRRPRPACRRDRLDPVRAVPGRLGLSFIWGPIADRFGRTRTLAATVLIYAIFTGAAALSQQRLGAGDLPLPGRDRHRRRMGHGRHLCRRGLAGGSPQDGRGLSADRLLRRLLRRRRAELHRRRILGWRAMFACGLAPVVVCDRHPAQGQGAAALATSGMPARPVRRRRWRDLSTRTYRRQTSSMSLLRPWRSSACGPARSMSRRRSSRSPSPGHDRARRRSRMASFGTASCRSARFSAASPCRCWPSGSGGADAGALFRRHDGHDRAASFGWAFYLPAGTALPVFLRAVLPAGHRRRQFRRCSACGCRNCSAPRCAPPPSPSAPRSAASSAPGQFRPRRSGAPHGHARHAGGADGLRLCARSAAHPIRAGDTE
jgi:acetolactate synthase-1/2/3 large subunit